MKRGLRSTTTVVTAALALLAAACTVEDASDKRAADSLAALTAKNNVQTSSAGAMASPATGAGMGTAQPASATGAAQATPATGNTVDSASGAAGAGASGTSPASGNLAPDSVDVGRTSKTTLLPVASTRIEVDLNAKQLRVYDGDKQVGTYRVAVGSQQWPTQTGEWNITQVIWNPEWIPPKDEAWAEAKDPKKPGAPDNPLGRAQLVYDPPRTIHGTNEPQSIGKAVSHGSIRLANADVVKLARQLMEVTGVRKDDAWYRQVQQNRTEKVPVDLPQRVPIRVF
jgi:lipoprotein-anchoring transpeptidase ErfK/SrfK